MSSVNPSTETDDEVIEVPNVSAPSTTDPASSTRTNSVRIPNEVIIVPNASTTSITDPASSTRTYSVQVPKVTTKQNDQVEVPKMSTLNPSTKTDEVIIIPNASEPSTSTPKDISNTRTYNVRVPKLTTKQNHLMRFNGSLKVDFSKWSKVKMIREDNSALYKLQDFGTTKMPKFGAGSEFGREQREAARRRKYGGNAKKYKPENQPWILKTGTGEASKKFKGVREGGVTDNASYFIFAQAPNGTFEVFPIKEWFNFTPIQRYKTLSAEEAEEKFTKRDKIMNMFSVMFHKRLKDGKEEADEDDFGDKVTTKKDKAYMKVSDMDDWIAEEEEDDSDSDEDGSKAAAKQKGKPKKKSKKEDSDIDPMEDSDDGDEDGREQDYMTDVSSSDEDEEEKKPELQGVDQDDALRAFLESESSSEEDEESKLEEKKNEKPVERKKEKKSTKKKKKQKSVVVVKTLDFTPILISVNDPELKGDDGAASKPDPVVPEVKTDEGNPGKRKAVDSDINPNTPKRHTVSVPQTTLQIAASEGITEETVRKYLQRKPMTIAELLQKFKLKKSKISSNALVPVIAHILKNLNPSKRNQLGKTYFYISPQNE